MVLDKRIGWGNIEIAVVYEVLPIDAGAWWHWSTGENIKHLILRLAANDTQDAKAANDANDVDKG